MDFLKTLCSLPTAPFAEHSVIAFVQSFAREHKLRLTRDSAGNLLLSLPGRERLPRWVFAAHMDHPGLIARRIIDARTLDADFRGSVLADYLKGEKVRFFSAGAQITGRIESAMPDKGGQYAARAVVRVTRPVPRETPGMFDQGEGRIAGDRFFSRVCDNLAGAAAALAMMETLRSRPPATPIAVLLTRAEEVGFVGAMAAVRSGTLLRKTDRLITIECSAMQPYAPQGQGPIIRVGDRTSIFNSGLTYFLTQQAEALARRDKSFHYQRALMPGGTCEATVYDVYGYLSTSICIALGNYHNMDRDRHRIAPEYVQRSDWQGMLKLFIHLARTAHHYTPANTLLKARLEKRFRSFQHLL